MLTPEEYASGKKMVCPQCGAHGLDLECGALDFDVTDTPFADVTCLECGASWVETYALTGYRDLCIDDKPVE